ncbi:MAG: RNA methyltransferase [Bacteroidales bacterium]|jgi:TrmH family RNA methyltransferase|nr:RNA methyltransferase [Bacteroidales bacterium]MDD3273479.1 RNA methyltransferase [Bacteroidales bacterium]MDD4057633.1 RNA methyltransferase [Bacteroidales bacterium]
MISKQELKFVKSLAQKKFRDENSMFVIEGEKLLQEAERSNVTILKIYRREEIGDENMSKISQLASPSPVLAVLKMPEVIENPKPNPEKIQLSLDMVKDPGNLGTIIRIADWYGIDDIFLSNGCVEVYNPKCVQSTMGALFRVRVHYVDLPAFINTYKDLLPVYGTFLNATSIYKTNLENKGLIVLGSESDGISKEVASLIDKKIMIPPFPINSKRSESLNVAIATAVICAEFRRPFGA